jgi:Cap4-like dsDNA endonuclease family protein
MPVRLINRQNAHFRRRHGKIGLMSEPEPPEPLDDPLLLVPAEEDAGAQTQSRYAFQWNCAVPFVLATLAVSDPIHAVVCETHEDIVVLHAHGPELVSVKHRELTQPPWALRDLVDGPLGHLAGRWLATGQRARCRFMTNHGLRPGDADAGGLRDACQNGATTALRSWAEQLSDPLALPVDEALAMLRELRIETDLPSRDHIADIYCVHTLRPVMRRLGLSIDAEAVAYERLLGQIARCCTDRTRAPEAILEAMLAEDGHTALAVLRRRIAQRTLTAEDVTGCLRGLPSRAPRLAESESVPEATRLVRKLEAGAVGPTAIRSAQRLRAAWYDLEARWRGLPGGGGEFTDLRLRAQALAAEVESEIASTVPYGPRMHTRLAQRLASGELVSAAPFALDQATLLGLIFQLTDECEIWWSPPSAVT